MRILRHQNLRLMIIFFCLSFLMRLIIYFMFNNYLSVWYITKTKTKTEKTQNHLLYQPTIKMNPPRFYNIQELRAHNTSRIEDMTCNSADVERGWLYQVNNPHIAIGTGGLHKNLNDPEILMMHRRRHDKVADTNITYDKIFRPIVLRLEEFIGGDKRMRFTYLPTPNMASAFIEKSLTENPNISIHEVFSNKMKHMRRLYYDFDSNDETESESSFMYDIITSLNKVLMYMARYRIVDDNETIKVRIYTSHGLTGFEDEGKEKFSAHIVFDNVIFEKYQDLKRFNEMILSNDRYFDSKVYNKQSSLRVFGSNKLTGSGVVERQKILHAEINVDMNRIYDEGALGEMYEDGVVDCDEISRQLILDSLVTYIGDENNAGRIVYCENINTRYLEWVYQHKGYSGYVNAIMEFPSHFIVDNILEPSYNYYSECKEDGYEPDDYVSNNYYTPDVMVLPLAEDDEDMAEIVNEIIYCDSPFEQMKLIREALTKKVATEDVREIIRKCQGSCVEFKNFIYEGTTSATQANIEALKPISAKDIPKPKKPILSGVTKEEKSAWRRKTKEEKENAKEEADEEYKLALKEWHQEKINATIAVSDYHKAMQESGPQPSYYVNFTRHRSHLCSICQRRHENDTRTMFWIVFTDGAVRQYCSHAEKGSKSILLMKGKSNKKREKISFDQRINNALNGFTPQEPETTTATKRGEIRRINKKHLELSDYQFAHTLAVVSQMGTGKTQTIKAYLDANPGIQQIRYLSPRISFTNDLMKVFKDYKMASYRDIDFQNEKFVIVQYESLHKCKGMTKPDLLILDEPEQLLNCMKNKNAQNITKSFGTNFNMLMYFLKTSPKVLVLDATMGARTIGMLEDKRPGFETLINEYKTQEGKTMTMIETEGDFDKAIMRDIGAGLRLVIPTTSKKKSYYLEELIKGTYPNKRILLINGDNSSTPEIQEALCDVNTHFAQYDVLIYTSSIVAGVSFTVAGHFDKLYQYISTRSGDVPTSIQMIGRVRDITQGQYYCFIKMDPTAQFANATTRKDMLEYYNSQFNKMIQDGIIKSAHRRIDTKLQQDIKEVAMRDGGDIALYGCAGTFDASQQEHDMHSTNEWLETNIRQWLHESFCRRNYLAFYLHFISSFGFEIKTQPKVQDPQEDPQHAVSVRTAEVAIAQKDTMRNSSIVQLLQQEDPSTAILEAMMDIEQSHKSKQDHEIPHDDKIKLRRMKALLDVGYLPNTLDNSGISRITEKIHKPFMKIRVIVGAGSLAQFIMNRKDQQIMNATKIQEDEEDPHVAKTLIATQTEQYYREVMAVEFLGLLTSTEKSLDEKIDSSEIIITKSALLAETTMSKIQNYIDANEIAIMKYTKKSKTQLNVRAKDFANLMVFINSLLAPLAIKLFSVRAVTREERKPNADKPIFMRWVIDGISIVADDDGYKNTVFEMVE